MSYRTARNAREALEFRAALCLFATAAIAVAAIVVAFPEPVFVVEVETARGEVYAAGTGSSCEAAWEGAVIPADWTRMACHVEGGR